MELPFEEVLLRLGTATIAGLAIGLNRDLRNKPMGARTLALVSLGAALVSLAGVQYSDLGAHPDALSRVVQGIIQGVMGGISFIGAGVILRDWRSQSVIGLTTAATVWVAAALGVACGLAAWRTATVGIGLALFVLVVVGWIEKALMGKDEEDPRKDQDRRGG
jgi:putative Mg2+ transporter-C (MgtC) family protein